jgi:hypothetical protein
VLIAPSIPSSYVMEFAEVGSAVDERIAAVNGMALVRNPADDSGMPNFLTPTVTASVASR